MRRRCGGTWMRFVVSSSTSPSSSILPLSGRKSPAIMLISEVFPAPDRPNRAVTPPRLSNAAVTLIVPRLFLTSTCSMLIAPHACDSAPREPFRHEQGAEREDDRHDDQL